MTELIPGKRYCVTVEGTARDRHALYLGGDTCLYRNVLDRATVELLADPLPTTPGSVVRKDDVMAVLVTEGEGNWYWHRVNGVGGYMLVAELDGATVLFDAGAER